MKHNYDIRRNAPELPRARIDAHRDFDALLATHRATAPARAGARLRYLYIGLSAAAALLVAYFLVRPAAPVGYPSYETAYFAARPLAQPPLAAARPVFVSRRVSATEGGVLEYSSGSRVVVPRAAFATSRGAPVGGEVEVHYRELLDYLDYFRGGLPLRYDSAGVSYDLRAAGLVEIYAEQAGERLQLAPGKRLAVELHGTLPVDLLAEAPHFSVYRLDTAARNWVYQGPDVLAISPEKPKVNQAPRYPVEILLADWVANNPPPVAPVAPSRGRPGEPVFELDISQLVSDADQLADLRALPPRTLWQLAPGSARTPRELGSRTWTDARLLRRDARHYALTLIAPETTLSATIQPVLQGPAYESARAAYDAQQADYLLALQVYEQAQRDYAQRVRAEALVRERATEAESEAHDNAPAGRAVVHRFSANALGTYQVARPRLRPPVRAVVRFLAPDGTVYRDRPVFLAERRTGLLRRFVATDATELRYTANSDYLLWLVTDDERVALLPSTTPIGDGALFLADPVEVSNADELRRLLAY